MNIRWQLSNSSLGHSFILDSQYYYVAQVGTKLSHVAQVGSELKSSCLQPALLANTYSPLLFYIFFHILF